MNKNKILASILLLATTAISNVEAKTKSISNIIGFGDSFISMQGSFAEQLSTTYRIPTFTAGVNNFAGGQNYTDLANQLQTYLIATGGRADPNTFYLMYSTNPNLWDAMQLDLVAAGGITQQVINWGNSDASTFTAPQFTAALNTYVRIPLTNYLQQLSSAGAQHIILPTVFNDAYRQDEPGSHMQRATREINSTIDQVVENFSNLNIIFVDYAKLVEEIALNPSTYLPESEIAQLNHLNLGGVNYPSAFHNQHHTAYVNKMVANLIEATVEAPARISYARELPILTGMQFIQYVQSHAAALNGTNADAPSIPNNQNNSGCSSGDYVCDIASNNKVEIGTGIDYLSISGKQKVGFNPTKLKIKKGKGGDVYAYTNYKIGDDAFVGLQVMGADTKLKLGTKAKYNVKEYLIGIHGAYQLSNLTGYPVYVFAGAGVGQIQYDIKRYIDLGLVRRAEKGRPKGMHYLANIGIGYNYTINNYNNSTEPVHINPFINVSYQNISMKNYTERFNNTGTSSTMKFKQIPNRKSLITEIGTTFAMNDIVVSSCAKLNPSITLTYGHEFIKNNKKVYGAILNKTRYFWTKTYDSDKNFFGINGQVRANINNTHFGIKAGSRLAKNVKTYTIGLFAGIDL